MDEFAPRHRLSGEEHLAKLGYKVLESTDVVTGNGVVGLAQIVNEDGEFTVLWMKTSLEYSLGIDAITTISGYDIEVWREAIEKLRND